MSTPPQKSDSINVQLSREEQWVVHHVLTTCADDAIEKDESPPPWLVELLDRIESGTESYARYQVRKLIDALSTYLDEDQTPERDLVHARAVVSRFESQL